MSVFLVTYDLNKPGQNYDELLKKIKSYSWARLSESSYAICTNSSLQQVYSDVRSCLDKSDHIYMITLKKPYTGFGPQKVNEWLSESLTS